MLKQTAENINIFSEEEQSVIDKLFNYIITTDSSLYSALLQQKADLEQLALVIDRAPSFLNSFGFYEAQRNSQTLIKKLCNKELDLVINLPTKIVLGYGYMVSKLHFFGFILKLTINNPDLRWLQKAAEEIYTDVLFSIMAEELYKSILQTCLPTDPLTQIAANELIRLWENRFELVKIGFAHHIRDLWGARQKIIPVLGTLQGTIELMRLNFLLPPVWNRFLAKEGANPDLMYALEEFLFDLSFEEIDLLKKYMRKKQIAAIDRKKAEEILPKLLDFSPEEFKSRKEKTEQPTAVQLYLSFFERQANSHTRRKRWPSRTSGTLEEYFFKFIYREKIPQDM